MKKIGPVPDPDSLHTDYSMLQDAAFRAKVDDFNGRYLHWSELGYRTESEDERLRIWGAMKLARDIMAVRLDLCGMQYSFCMIPEFTELLHYIDRDAAGYVDARITNDRDAKHYFANSLMEEAIASSQIEGAATTRRDAKRMLMAKRQPRNTDERMILNNYLAMEGIKGTVSEDLTPGLICRMHATIVSGTLDRDTGWEGRFRETDDIVVGDPLDEEKVFHRPPGHEEVPELVSRLCTFANSDDGPYLHPVIKAIILHYLIGYIHPFIDGNGRLARSVFYWYCIKNGYWLMEYTSISSVIKGSQTKYGYAYQFTESDGNDLTYFIRFNLECIRKAVDDLTAYMDRKVLEQRSVLELVESNPDLNAIEAALLRDRIRDGASFTLYEVGNGYNVSYQTARTYVNHLVDMGLVQVVGKDRKQRIYSVDPERFEKILRR